MAGGHRRRRGGAAAARPVSGAGTAPRLVEPRRGTSACMRDRVPTAARADERTICWTGWPCCCAGCMSSPASRGSAHRSISSGSTIICSRPPQALIRSPASPASCGPCMAAGFYRSRKYRVAPAVLPPTLHWFYWEAYTHLAVGVRAAVPAVFFAGRGLSDRSGASCRSSSRPRSRSHWPCWCVSWLVYDAAVPLAARPQAAGAGRAIGLARSAR